MVDDIDWAGDSTILLSYVKGRTSAESLTLPKRAVRLLEQWLAHSALLRSHLDPVTARQLWVGVTRPGSSVMFSGAIHRNRVKAWVLQRGLVGDDGAALKVHRGRIRTTHLSMRDRRSWAGQGRATIDPNPAHADTCRRSSLPSRSPTVSGRCGTGSRSGSSAHN